MTYTTFAIQWNRKPTQNKCIFRFVFFFFHFVRVCLFRCILLSKWASTRLVTAMLCCIYTVYPVDAGRERNKKKQTKPFDVIQYGWRNFSGVQLNAGGNHAAKFQKCNQRNSTIRIFFSFSSSIVRFSSLLFCFETCSLRSFLAFCVTFIITWWPHDLQHIYYSKSNGTNGAHCVKYSTASVCVCVRWAIERHLWYIQRLHCAKKIM